MKITKGKTVFDADLELLECTVLPDSLADNPSAAAEADFFVFDNLPAMASGYVDSARTLLRLYREHAQDRFCFAAFPSAIQNYAWDVVNRSVSLPEAAALPGARWVYDELLRKFSVRAIGNMNPTAAIHCAVVRLVPLSRTLLCVMAASGQGKTTLVRQMTNVHSIFHVSSDYTLSYLIALKADPADPDALALRRAIQGIEPGRVWSEFFRLIEANQELLAHFLAVVHQHIALSEPTALVSFDIDMRSQAAQDFVAEFFRAKGMKVWSCTT